MRFASYLVLATTLVGCTVAPTAGLLKTSQAEPARPTMTSPPGGPPGGDAGRSMLAPANPEDLCNVYFGSYDLNGDGRATPAEFAEARMVPPGYYRLQAADTVGGPVNHGPGPAELEAAFAKLDLNKDGVLVRAEVCEAFDDAPAPAIPDAPNGVAAM